MDPAPKALRRKAHQAVYAYNPSDPLEDELPSAILKELLGSFGEDVFGESSFCCAYAGVDHDPGAGLPCASARCPVQSSVKIPCRRVFRRPER